MVARLLLLGFMAIPLVEIALFVVVGQAIGLAATLALVVISAVIGAAILRHQGLARFRELGAMVRGGQRPARAVADAVLVSGAGFLLLVPGFLTDVVGLLLLMPPVRELIYALVLTRMAKVVVPSASGGEPARPRTIELGGDQFRSRPD